MTKRALKIRYCLKKIDFVAGEIFSCEFEHVAIQPLIPLERNRKKTINNQPSKKN